MEPPPDVSLVRKLGVLEPQHVDHTLVDQRREVLAQQRRITSSPAGMMCSTWSSRTTRSSASTTSFACDGGNYRYAAIAALGPAARRSPRRARIPRASFYRRRQPVRRSTPTKCGSGATKPSIRRMPTRRKEKRKGKRPQPPPAREAAEETGLTGYLRPIMRSQPSRTASFTCFQVVGASPRCS